MNVFIVLYSLFEMSLFCLHFCRILLQTRNFRLKWWFLLQHLKGCSPLFTACTAYEEEPMSLPCTSCAFSLAAFKLFIILDLIRMYLDIGLFVVVYFTLFLPNFKILWVDFHVKWTTLVIVFSKFVFLLSQCISPLFLSNYTCKGSSTLSQNSLCVYPSLVFSFCVLCYRLFWTIFKDTDTFSWSFWFFSSLAAIFFISDIVCFHSRFFIYMFFSSLLKISTYSLPISIF